MPASSLFLSCKRLSLSTRLAEHALAADGQLPAALPGYSAGRLTRAFAFAPSA
jgi:hypothetical protein